MRQHEAQVARTSEGFSHVNTLNTKLEQRQIVYAQGLEFHNDQLPEVLRLPEALIDPSSSFGTMTSKAPLDITRISHDEFEYKNHEQGVRYSVRRVTTRDAFKAALADPNLHVIYAGHARYGRGPCFGRGTHTDRGNQWEDGTGPDNGIYRMGYPFIAVPVSEVLDHGYQANLVSSQVPVSASQSDPDLRAHIGRLRPLPAEQIHPGLPALAKDPNPTQTWWAFRAFYEQVVQEHVVLHAGWEQTSTAPFDLGATEVKARVFCHFGCSTMRHNQPVLRVLKGWQKQGDNRFAFFTTDLSNGTETVFYFYHLLSYPQYSRGKAWKPSLDYAVRKTNADLAASGFRHRLR